MSFFNVASIVLVSRDGSFIFQRRDDKPTIRNPEMITTWGGAAEGGETPLQAATRETREETNLTPSEGEFEYFGKYPRDYKIDGKQVVNYVYLLRGIDESKLKVYEGQGFVVVRPGDTRPNGKYTELTKRLLVELS